MLFEKLPLIYYYLLNSLNFAITDYDVYPYATFTVPNQLQTFTHRDCTEGNLMSENTHSIQRKRRNSSKNLTDTLSLGENLPFILRS